jgi:zinc transport system ATP-binding protein
MSRAVEFEDVSFTYEETPVLSHVAFSVEKGEYIGLIGPNGGGKTTLLQLLMGFLTPTEGIIRVFDQTPLQSRQKIAYVPQAMRFDREFPISVLEVVLSGRLSHLTWYGKYPKADLEAAEEALRLVNMLEFAHRAIGKLSGGQIQRALIARAIVSHPELLLLDEPTANVDAKVAADIYRILKELGKKMTVMMVTHDLQTVINEVDRILCVQNSVVSLTPGQVCGHFAMGLYHPPLRNS